MFYIHFYNIMQTAVVTIAFAHSFISSADDVSAAELIVLLSFSVVRPSTFALNRYSSYSSYSIILNFLLEKLAI